MLFKEIVDARTDDGRRTPDIEGSQKLTEHFVLRWANKLILMYETALANPVAYLKQKCKWFDQKYFFYILTLLS